jgi:hypothetical protein
VLVLEKIYITVYVDIRTGARRIVNYSSTLHCAKATIGFMFQMFKSLCSKYIIDTLYSINRRFCSLSKII